MSLPAGEDTALWRVAFSLAGLEVAAQGQARVSIEASESGWVLRATGADGVLRTARIAAPQSAADREEVAFLARGLLRAIEADAASVPGPLPVKLPPVALPPPPPIQVAAVPKPEPRTIGPVEVVPEVGPVVNLTVAVEVAVTMAPGEPRFDPLPKRAEPAPLPAPEPYPPEPSTTAGSSRKRKDRPPGWIAMPPLQVSSGASIRPGIQPAWAVGMGMDFARFGGTSLGWDMSFLAPRGLPLEREIQRNMRSLEWELEVLAPVGDWARLGADGGVSYRWYVQQDAAIANGPVPIVGAKGALVLLPMRRWAVDLYGGVKFDLMETRLVRPDNSEENLVPVEFRTEISFRWWGGGDPFSADPTSKR